MPLLVFLINAMILGYVLNFSGLILYYLDGNKIGVLLSLLSFAAAYFSERDFAFDTDHPKVTYAMQIMSILFCAMSLGVWFF